MELQIRTLPDRRRTASGDVRQFVVDRFDAFGDVECTNQRTGKRHCFPRSRFGSARANDSFERVEAAAQLKTRYDGCGPEAGSRAVATLVN